jgi:hypothetical protein
MSDTKLHSIKAVFSQASSTDSEQWEELSVEMTFMPGAEEAYFTLKTKQWAVDSTEQLATIFESMQKMAEYHETLL